jgi:hypothetical protein
VFQRVEHLIIRFLDHSVEAQLLKLDGGNDSINAESNIMDFRWREKVFRVSPRFKFDSVVELKIHLEKYPDPQTATDDDME